MSIRQTEGEGEPLGVHVGQCPERTWALYSGRPAVDLPTATKMAVAMCEGDLWFLFLKHMGLGSAGLLSRHAA